MNNNTNDLKINWDDIYEKTNPTMNDSKERLSAKGLILSTSAVIGMKTGEENLKVVSSNLEFAAETVCNMVEDIEELISSNPVAMIDLEHFMAGKRATMLGISLYSILTASHTEVGKMDDDLNNSIRGILIADTAERACDIFIDGIGKGATTSNITKNYASLFLGYYTLASEKIIKEKKKILEITERTRNTSLKRATAAVQINILNHIGLDISRVLKDTY